MKAFKLILTTLLFLASFAAEAQNVVIYKDGNIVKEYTAEQVDSVVYVPAKEVKYYYYVGTEKPTAENLATIGTLIGESISGYSKDNKLVSESIKITDIDGNSVRSNYYVCIPEGLGIYDDDGHVEWDQYGEINSTFTIGTIKYIVYYSLSTARSFGNYIY